jgi:histidinol-phosphate aminotransferase
VLGRALLGCGIKVRVLRALPGIGDAIRVGVGPWDGMEQLLAALREVQR